MNSSFTVNRSVVGSVRTVPPSRSIASIVSVTTLGVHRAKNAIDFDVFVVSTWRVPDQSVRAQQTAESRAVCRTRRHVVVLVDDESGQPTCLSSADVASRSSISSVVNRLLRSWMIRRTASNSVGSTMA